MILVVASFDDPRGGRTAREALLVRKQAKQNPHKTAKYHNSLYLQNDLTPCGGSCWSTFPIRSTADPAAGPVHVLHCGLSRSSSKIPPEVFLSGSFTNKSNSKNRGPVDLRQTCGGPCDRNLPSTKHNPSHDADAY